jgi:hypothetical protein
MKSPHAAVLGLHVGQVERIMRRRHAVGSDAITSISREAEQY